MQQQTIKPLDGLQFSLLPDLPADDPPPSAVQVLRPVVKAAPPPPKAPCLNDVFERYTETVANINALIDEQHAFENQFFGNSLIARPSEQGVYSIAESAIKALICRAERQFAPSGGTLDINQGQALKATGQQNWNEYWHRSRHREEPKIPVDLDKLWAYLEKTYGGDGGKNEGYRQLAAKIINFFNLERNAHVSRTNSGVTLSRMIYSEKKTFGSNSGQFEVSYSYSSDIRELFSNLSCFAEYAGLDAFAIAIHPSRHTLGDYGRGFTTREKESFPGLDVIQYKEKWDFRFSHDVAEKLMVFLGEFGAK